MQIYGPAQVHGPQAITGPHATRAASNPAPAHSAASDELSISETGELLARVRDLPEMRAERVAQIRAEIAAGTYEDDAKLDAALDRLLDEIG